MSRSLRFLIPALFALALVLAGCAKPEDKYAGTYTGKMQLSQKTLDLIAKQPKAAQDQILNATVKLELNKDKTATLTPSGQTAGTSGSWSVQNGEIAISLGGGAPLQLKPTSPGQLVLDNDMGTMTFTKN